MPLFNLHVHHISAKDLKQLNSKLDNIMSNQAAFAEALEAQKLAYENLKADIERQNGKIDAQTSEIKALTEHIEIGGMSSIEEGEILKTLNAQVLLLQELSLVVPEPPVVDEPVAEEPVVEG